jgi:hypothetical protein
MSASFRAIETICPEQRFDCGAEPTCDKGDDITDKKACKKQACSSAGATQSAAFMKDASYCTMWAAQRHTARLSALYASRSQYFPDRT